MKITNLILGNEHAGTGSDLTQLALTGQIIGNRGSLELRFGDGNQVVAFQFRQETLVNESSAPSKSMQSSFAQYQLEFDKKNMCRNTNRPRFPRNLFDLGRVYNSTSGPGVGTPRSVPLHHQRQS